jgi:hypothetical protein
MIERFTSFSRYFLLIANAILLFLHSSSWSLAYPMCGDCWCIPRENGTMPCPIWTPQTEFSSEVIEAYRTQSASTIYTLSCNPYEDSECATYPEQSFLDFDTAVCGFLYTNKTASRNALLTATENCPGEYSLVTFRTREEAYKSGAVVTHEGSCGLCSTTKDLAVYLSKTYL